MRGFHNALFLCTGNSARSVEALQLLQLPDELIGVASGAVGYKVWPPFLVHDCFSHDTHRENEGLRRALARANSSQLLLR